MSFSTVSEFSIFETLQQKLLKDVSVTLLAELERELLRLRYESTGPEWNTFCSEFHKRPLFNLLSSTGGASRSLEQVLQAVSAKSFQARPSIIQSAAHILNAWEYSLPISRSLRARNANFSREIAETIREIVKPRILILGAARMGEAGDALQSSFQHHARFVVLEADSNHVQTLRRRHAAHRLEVVHGNWQDLSRLSATLGSFDLIYSSSWLDLCDDFQVAEWLWTSAELLRTGGRLLAANCAPGSPDMGWIEACWNWHPNYRSEEDLAQLVVNLKHPAIRGHLVFRDESGASTFLEVHSL